MRTLGLVACLATGLLFAPIATGCGGKSATAAPEPADNGPKGPKMVKLDPKTLERLGVKVEVAGGREGESRLEIPGSLEYNIEKYAEIGTVVDGRVSQIMVRVGDKVKKGQTLGTLVVPSIAQAQADYIAAEAAARTAKDHAAREENLLGQQLTTAHEAEVARADAVRTQSEHQAAAARLQVLGVAKPIQGAQISGAGTLTLVAPIDGVVVRRDAVLGKFLHSSETAFVVADPTDLRASLNVYESDLVYFHVGADAEIFVDSMNKTVKGKIALLEPQVGKASRAVRALIAVPNPDGQLRPGLFVRAAVSLPEHTQGDRIVVPGEAVQPIGEDDVVFVEVGGGQFEVRRVVVARRTPQVSEIREGLNRGERIVVEGAFVLRGEVTKQ